MIEEQPHALVDGDGYGLLNQLEKILERDPLIDEVGFIHPSQLLALNEDAGSTTPALGSDITQAEDDTLGHKSAVFWNSDHKLGISTNYLYPLYNAAKCRFMEVFARYKASGNAYGKRNDHCDDDAPNNCSFSEIESDLMNHSKALLLLSSNFGTAWNSRKLVASKKQSLSVFVDELLLSTLVLSFAPKTDNAWSHRRWAIKMIAGKCANLDEILDKESELVEKIAEKSKMNYRAWNHRIWLVSYMSGQQVLHELNKSRKWAGLHVADNSCFHYRRRLMLRMLDDAKREQRLVPRSTQFESLHGEWKEELDWNEMLIRRYIGREALWLHRRFLSICWVENFMEGNFATSTKDGKNGTESDLSDFMDHELQLIQHCSGIQDNDFEDVHAQAVHAATYVLWLTKHISRSSGTRLQVLQVKLPISDLMKLLNDASPDKAKLWIALAGTENRF